MTGTSVAEVDAVVRRWFYTEPLPMLRNRLREGVLELLVSARRCGVKTAALSDYPADEKLQALGVRELFDVVVCAQDVEVQTLKPDPRGLKVTLERLGVRRDHALYIGDRADVDAAAAERAGIACAIMEG